MSTERVRWGIQSNDISMQKNFNSNFRIKISHKLKFGQCSCMSIYSNICIPFIMKAIFYCFRLLFLYFLRNIIPISMQQQSATRCQMKWNNKNDISRDLRSFDRLLLDLYALIDDFLCDFGSSNNTLSFQYQRNWKIIILMFRIQMLI